MIAVASELPGQSVLLGLRLAHHVFALAIPGGVCYRRMAADTAADFIAACGRDR